MESDNLKMTNSKDLFANMTQVSSDFNDDNFAAFRKHHFEVYISNTNTNEVFEYLRLAINYIETNLVSNIITVKLYTTKQVLNCISDIVNNNISLHLKYVLFSPDVQDSFVAYNKDVHIKEITFESDAESSKVGRDIITIKFSGIV